MNNARKSFEWGAAALIVLLTVVVYLPALRGGFIWDDDDHLTKNPAMESVHGLEQIWSSLAVSRYYPLTLTTFWVERRAWGLHPLPYHAVNIALQAANAVLLWILLRRLNVRGAWIAAMLWAVHPVNVETVAWVTELKNTQSVFFFLLSLLFFLQFDDGLRPRDYGIALGCGVAAMLSKPSTVVLPAVILLCAWWRRCRWTHRDFLRVAPLVAFAGGMSLLTIVEQRHQIEGAGHLDWTLTATQRLLLAGRATWFYAAKLFWPVNLCFIYPRWDLSADWVASWLPLAGLMAVAGTLWRFRRAAWARAAIFGLVFFLIGLLPMLGFFDIYFFRYSFVADHFQYLASMGLIALAAGAVATAFERMGESGRRLGMFGGAAILLCLGVCTWGQTQVYKDSETLWRNTLAINPSAWMAHNNLAAALSQEGRSQEAIAHYKAALRLQTHYAEPYYNLGIALARSGRGGEAIGPWQQALRLNPNYPPAHFSLAVALQETGRVTEAIEQFEEALRLQPDYAEAHSHLGSALFQQGQVSEAIGHWEQALQINPDDAEVHYDLGLALAQQGRTGDAIRNWEQALQINPNLAAAHYNLGVALAGQGKVTEATGHWEQALRINPRCAEAHYNLGLALEQVGKTNEAINHYEQALRIKPDYTEAQKALGRLRATP